MFEWFKCRICQEKDKRIAFLEQQNKDLYDRLMAFNKDAFTYYKAETKKGSDLFPIGMDKDGKVFSYENTDIEGAREEVLRAYGEEIITVEEPQET